MSTFLFRHSYIRLKGLFEVLKVRLKPLSDGSESGLGVMIWGGSGQWGRKVMDYSTLLSHIRFETRMKLLCSFLHFCRVHEYTNQEPSSRKSFPRRFLKKMKNSRFLASFCIDYFSGWFDLSIDSIMIILMKFPFI